MRRLLLFVLAFAWQCAAQFTGLASNGDGSVLYFSSPLRIRGSGESFNPKIFRMDSSGPTLFRSQDPGPPVGWTVTNFPNLTAPQVSTDGAVVAFSGERGCGGGSGCITVQKVQGTVVDRNGNQLLSAFGYVDISPSGRYALFFARDTFATLIPPAEFVDLATGIHTVVPYPVGAPAHRRIANDGTVALRSGNSIRLWQAQGEQTISGLAIFAPSGEPLLFLSADGQRLVYQTPTGLALYDRGAPGEQALVAGVPASASISDDAGVVAFVNAADSQVHIALPPRQLTHESDGITEVALSGDGRVAFATTGQGRLLRIEVGSGAVTELVPRTPWITNSRNQAAVETYIYDAVAPGSLLPLAGIGLSASTQATAAPLPRSLGDVRVRIGGLDAALQSVTPQLVWFQVPWELPPQDSAPLEFLSGNSPFETGPGVLNVQPLAPHTFGTADSSNGYSVYSLAVHQDWSGLVTPADPARPGEVIHLYFNGLGPVTPAVATGEASPAEPPARVIAPLHCQFWDGKGNDSPILFAGLAPGMVGVYQVSLQVPAGLRISNPGITCDSGVGTLPTVGSTFVMP